LTNEGEGAGSRFRSATNVFVVLENPKRPRKEETRLQFFTYSNDAEPVGDLAPLPLRWAKGVHRIVLVSSALLYTNFIAVMSRELSNMRFVLRCHSARLILYELCELIPVNFNWGRIDSIIVTIFNWCRKVVLFDLTSASRTFICDVLSSSYCLIVFVYNKPIMFICLYAIDRLCLSVYIQ